MSSRSAWRVKRVSRSPWSRKVMRLRALNWEVIDSYRILDTFPVTVLRVPRGGGRG